jgi:hypothetical protein
MDFPERIPPQENNVTLFPNGLQLSVVIPTTASPIEGYLSHVKWKSANVPFDTVHLLDCPAPNVIVYSIGKFYGKLIYIGLPGDNVYRLVLFHNGRFSDNIGVYKKGKV